jgi:hypothetical protein
MKLASVARQAIPYNKEREESKMNRYLGTMFVVSCLSGLMFAGESLGAGVGCKASNGEFEQESGSDNSECIAEAGEQSKAKATAREDSFAGAGANNGSDAKAKAVNGSGAFSFADNHSKADSDAKNDSVAEAEADNHSEADAEASNESEAFAFCNTGGSAKADASNGSFAEAVCGEFPTCISGGPGGRANAETDLGFCFDKD